MSLQAAYGLLPVRGEKRHLDVEGEQTENTRENTDAQRKAQQSRLREFRARRDLSRAGYKVREMKEQLNRVEGVDEIGEGQGNVESRDVDATVVIVAPLFGTKIDGEKEEVEEIVQAVVNDLVNGVDAELLREEVSMSVGRKRNGATAEERCLKKPRIVEEGNQKSPQYKAEESEEDEQPEIVDLADRKEDEEDEEAESAAKEREAMGVSEEDEEDDGYIFINPFHQPDFDEDDEVEEVIKEVDVDEEDEIEVTREVAADSRVVLERAATKRLEAVKRLDDEMKYKIMFLIHILK